YLTHGRLKSLLKEEIHTGHPVFLAQRHYRPALVQRPLHLYHLRIAGRDVRNVGKGDVRRYLLLQRQTRLGICIDAGNRWIDLEAAHPEEALQPSTDWRRNRLPQQRRW